MELMEFCEDLLKIVGISLRFWRSFSHGATRPIHEDLMMVFKPESGPLPPDPPPAPSKRVLREDVKLTKKGKTMKYFWPVVVTITVIFLIAALALGIDRVNKESRSVTEHCKKTDMFILTERGRIRVVYDCAGVVITESI